MAMDVEARLARLTHGLADDSDVAAIYLFGSRGRGTAGPRSDVDLAVVLRDGLDARERWAKRLELMARAATALGTDAVDVLVLEDAPSLLGHRVLRDGRILLERDARRRTAVAESVLRRYLDEAPIRSALDAALAERVNEGRFGR